MQEDKAKNQEDEICKKISDLANAFKAKITSSMDLDPKTTVPALMCLAASAVACAGFDKETCVNWFEEMIDEQMKQADKLRDSLHDLATSLKSLVDNIKGKKE